MCIYMLSLRRDKTLSFFSSPPRRKTMTGILLSSLPCSYSWLANVKTFKHSIIRTLDRVWTTLNRHFSALLCS